MCPFITVFGRKYATYSLIAVAAAIAVGALFCRRIKKHGLDDNDAVIFLLICGVGALVGGSLLYGITNLGYLSALGEARTFKEWAAALASTFGGSVFYGGLLGAMGAGCIYLKAAKLPIVTYADSIAPFVPLFHGFARIGCFFGGCCYGIECEFGFVATGNDIVPGLCGVRRFPVQLLEAAVNFLLFAVLTVLYRKRRDDWKGAFLPLYLGAYSVARFFIEFLRGDEYRGYVGVLSTSQFISLLLFGASFGVLTRYFTRKRAAARD